MTKAERRHFYYWSEKLPKTVASLRRLAATLEQLEDIPVPPETRRAIARLRPEISETLMSAGTELDAFIRGEEAAARGRIAMMLGAVLERTTAT